MYYDNILTDKFYSAISGDIESRKYIIDYFTKNVERQLENLNLTKEEKAQRTVEFYESLIRNLSTCYEYNSFFNSVMRATKSIVYLNKVPTISSSRDIIKSQEAFKSRVTAAEIGSLNMPVLVRETARLYFVENKSIGEVATLMKADETIVCRRLARVGKAISRQKVSNCTQDEEMFVYNK